MSLSPDTSARLRELEESLWRAETRFDRGHMEQVLHTDFLEFGRSGRTYDREQCIAMDPGELVAELRDFAAHPVGDDTVLVTYLSVVTRADTIEVANRSSLWVRSGNDWRLRFHQGTPVPQPRD